MRYFIQPRRETAKAIQCTDEYARRAYRENAWGARFGSLNAIEKFVRGDYSVGPNFQIWGEDVSEKILFERILKGELKPGILEYE